MANIHVTKQKGASILQNRIFDLDAFDFDREFWKARTIKDLAEIFGDLSRQKEELQAYKFTPGNMYLADDKMRLRRLIQSFIDYIDDYVTEDKSFKTIEAVIPKHIIKHVSAEPVSVDEKLIIQIRELKSTISDQQSQIESLKNSVFQTDNLTPIKLWRFIIHLPWESWVAIITILVGIFFAGVWASAHKLT